MKYLAHKKISEGIAVEQTLEEHSRNAAEIAKKCLEPVGLPNVGYLAGLLHDVGKCKKEFQIYLEDGSKRRGSVNHTFAGCRMILERFHSKEKLESFRDVTAELLAYAIGAHHGLFDCVDKDGKSGFEHRLHQEKIAYEESRDTFFSQCANDSEIEALFERASEELEPVYEAIKKMLVAERAEESSFYLGVLARLLLSAVMEGDRKDTAAFMRIGEQRASAVPSENFWRIYLERMEEALQKFPRNNPIQEARARISEQCRRFAENPGGIYRLNVPTGAGKTLSSLRYALAHAKKWGKSRIVFVSPLLSILEQNSKAIRDAIKDDSIILEHHSNVIKDDYSDEELDERELAVENWEKPIIITTLVQLLNVFFEGRSSAVRRFHSLCNAIVVLDEVQTVPGNMLSLFNLTLNFLSRVCNTTFVLCSATQPCFENAEHPLLEQPDSIVPYDEKLFAPFSRTVIFDRGEMTLEEIASMVEQELETVSSILVVCNKRIQSEMLYRLLAPKGNCFHLSASMCVAHRTDTIEAIKGALLCSRNDSSFKTICVSTQVIEAGVDISFEQVIRFRAGMDSVVQAAGRCNRNGESAEKGRVYMVACVGENLSHLAQIEEGKSVTTELLNEYKKDPRVFYGDLASELAVRRYYEKLYQRIKDGMEGYQDFTVKSERNTLFSMLGNNDRYYGEQSRFYGKYQCNQAFKLAGKLFHVFDDDTEEAVVPYGKGKELIAELKALSFAPSADFLAKFIEKIKPYTVSLYDYQKEKLGNCLACVGGIWILEPQAYDDAVGLISTEIKAKFLEA